MIRHSLQLLLFLATCSSIQAADESNYYNHDEHNGYSGSCPTTHHNSPSQKSLLLDELFPEQSLDEAWETKPLLSTVYASRGGGGGGAVACKTSNSSISECGLAPITTVIVSHEEKEETNCDASTAKRDSAESFAPKYRHRKRFARLLSLFSLNDVNTVLHQPGISHRDDFLVVRKVVQNNTGEEWTGQLPQDVVPIEVARRAIELGGFSLVIKAMQRRWRPIADFARQIRNETGTNYVSMNLYLTPDTLDRRTGRGKAPPPGSGEAGEYYGHVARRHAFEYHWDWMDVIVLQISGTKLWSVSRSPTEYLSPRDMKRKPTLDEVRQFLSSVVGDETTSRASTKNGRYDDFLLRPGDALYIPRGFIHNASTVSPTIAAEHMYSGGSSDGQQQEEFEFSGPSLHLTVGIEATFETTYEALVHHTLAVWDSTMNHNQGTISLSSSCVIRWETFLHFAAGDVARRNCRLGYEEEGCILRRSVPRGTLWEDRIANKARNPDDKREILLKSIRTIQKHSLAKGAKHMATLVMKANGADGDHKEDYYIPVPGMNQMEEIQCIAKSIKSVNDKTLEEHWEEVYKFANESFDVVMSRFEEHLESLNDGTVQKDEAELNRVGQV